MNKVIKALALLGLVAYSSIGFAISKGEVDNYIKYTQCPPGSVFSNSGPDTFWEVSGYSHWWFDDNGSQNSPLTAIPDESVSYVILYLHGHNAGAVQCTYGEYETGIHSQLDLGKDYIYLSKDNIPKGFTDDGNDRWICYFPAGQPEACAAQ